MWEQFLFSVERWFIIFMPYQPLVCQIFYLFVCLNEAAISFCTQGVRGL